MDLLNILDDLRAEEFETFKWHLKNEEVGDIRPIKVSQLSEAERRDTVDLMVQKYKSAGAVEVTTSILKKISRSDLVQELSNTSSGAEGQSQEEKIMTSHQCKKSHHISLMCLFQPVLPLCLLQL